MQLGMSPPADPLGMPPRPLCRLPSTLLGERGGGGGKGLQRDVGRGV